MAKEAFYIKHDYTAHTDPKIERMLFKEGWEGYGLYWAIIEKLSQETGEWKLPTEYESLAFALRTDEERICRIVETYELFKIEGNKFWSNRVLSQMLEREEKRIQSKKAADKRWGKQEDKAKDDATAYANAMPGEERIGEESKGKKERTNSDFELFWNSYNKKVDRKKCETAWKNLTKKNKTLALANVEAYVKSTPEVKYRKNPLTYLHGESWNDEAVEDVTTPEQDYKRIGKSFTHQDFVKKHGEDVAMQMIL